MNVCTQFYQPNDEQTNQPTIAIPRVSHATSVAKMSVTTHTTYGPIIFVTVLEKSLVQLSSWLLAVRLLMCKKWVGRRRWEPLSMVSSKWEAVLFLRTGADWVEKEISTKRFVYLFKAPQESDIFSAVSKQVEQWQGHTEMLSLFQFPVFTLWRGLWPSCMEIDENDFWDTWKALAGEANSINCCWSRGRNYRDTKNNLQGHKLNWLVVGRENSPNEPDTKWR